MPKCRACGAEIEFIEMAATHKKMPVNAEAKYYVEEKNGPIEIITHSGHKVRARPVLPTDRTLVIGYRAHWITCGAADQMRKKPEKPTEPKKPENEQLSLL